MEIPEILIIGVIILLWLLSIKKFTKQFERIRTTHYREIPYSYHATKINDNKITIVQHETDSIIHAATYKTSRSKSLPSDQYKIIDDNETNKNKSSSNSENNSPQNKKNELKLKRISISNCALKSDSLSPIVVEFDASPKKLGSICTFNIKSNLINPLLIPPIVRRSLLDLHRRSAEHLAIQMPHRDYPIDTYFHKSCDRVNKTEVLVESNV
jgi:hypothetical protein